MWVLLRFILLLCSDFIRKLLRRRYYYGLVGAAPNDICVARTIRLRRATRVSAQRPALARRPQILVALLVFTDKKTKNMKWELRSS